MIYNAWGNLIYGAILLLPEPKKEETEQYDKDIKFMFSDIKEEVQHLFSIKADNWLEAMVEYRKINDYEQPEPENKKSVELSKKE